MKCDKQEFTVWINWTALQRTRLLIKQTAQSSVQGNSPPSSTFFVPFSHVNKPILRSVNVYPRHTRVSAAGTWLKLEAAGRIPFVVSCNYNWESFRTNWTRLHTYMYAPSHTETGAKEMLNHESWRPRDRNCQMSCTRQWSAVGVDVAYTSVPTEKWGSRSLVWYVFRINGTKGGFFSPTAHHHHDVNNRTLLLLQNKQQTLRQTWKKKKRNMAPNRKTDYALQSKTIHSPLTSTIQPAGSRDIEGILVYSCNCHNQWVI